MSMKTVAIVMTLLSLVLAGTTQALGHQVLDCQPLPAAQMCPAAAAATTTVRFRIRGMSTPNCPVLVKAAVSRIKGVTRVDADLATKSATVEFVTGSTTAQAIQAVIKDQTGYEAESIQ